MSAPLNRQFTLDYSSAATSSNAGGVLGPMPFAGSVTAIRYIPTATVAGGIDVNHRMLRLFNRGTAGTGTVSMGVLDLTSANANGTLTDNVPSSLSLSASAALLFTIGDVLRWQSSFSATGMVDPGGRVVVDVTRTVS